MIEKALDGSFKEKKAITVALMALDTDKVVTKSEFTKKIQGKLTTKEGASVIKLLEKRGLVSSAVHYTPARGRNTVTFLLLPDGAELLKELLA